ncbi:MAG: hydroxyacid dehydrogenase, partial [Eubacteriales bacterium]|nr:hydroxyacid dehydrogenase [Eubacteriales bacterium]
VLDDDPTGIQTVHGVSVYTTWDEKTLLDGFREDGAMFFILTNSRALTSVQTEALHREIALNIAFASRNTGKDFLIISRGDSTLRGHYPLETETIRRTLEAETGRRYDGEIILPFFIEGGRYTLDNVHYVKEGNRLIPVGKTEFAGDKTFGYHASHLGHWCEEKTNGQYQAEDMIYLSLGDLRDNNIVRLVEQLSQAENFQKIIVNAAAYVDVEVFSIALCKAMQDGKEYMFRSAAALPKVLGGVPDKPLLTPAELVVRGESHGGMVLVGSHVGKTSKQLEVLLKSNYPIDYIEFNQHLVLIENGLEGEVVRVSRAADASIAKGRTVVVYTRRERVDLPSDDREGQLRISVQISSAVTDIVARLTSRPRFIVAKGGITSSDVGTKALGVKRAIVMGQIAPGVPVWQTGPESKFPHIPYVIFPGNVGEDFTLRTVVERLIDADH